MTTIGTRLDQLIAEVETMPSTQLYAILFAASVAFSFFLLNCGNPVRNSAPPSASIIGEKTIPVRPRSPNEPQPKWFILKRLNYAMVIGFLLSIGMFASNATIYMDDSSKLIQFLIFWSVFLCYFFGFFGISFVDADEIMAESEASSQAPENGLFTDKGTTKASSSEMAPQSITSKPLYHLPVSCSPVCATSCKQLSPGNLSHLSNEEVVDLYDKTIKDHQLEKLFGGFRAVEIRRIVLAKKLNSLKNGQGNSLNNLPYVPEVANWYDRVHGANCEIVAGYVTIPVGVAGPLLLNNEMVYIPMATTEGCLVASTNRGCKAISTGGMGATSSILRDGITRAPCLQFSSAMRAAQAKLWIEDSANTLKLKKAFDSTTSFGKLIGIEPTVAGKNVYLRLKCFSGDAMGMNMVSKGSLAVVDLLKTVFEDVSLVALSGNTCTDKKSAAINWIEGRGKSVVVETIISKDVVKSILKTTVEALVSVNINKNLIGSAIAGSIGGFNAHAANMVTAIFLATGQDPAQNVESSSCITLMEETSEGHLWMSCTMPSIEVGTVGGGTSLPAQSACLDIIGCKGGGKEPGDNAQKLAHVVAGAVLAGELSLLAALAANTLVQAHMQHNRKPAKKSS